MAAGATEDAGALVACPCCGTEVNLKTTIPYLTRDGARTFACTLCARSFVSTAGAVHAQMEPTEPTERASPS